MGTATLVRHRVADYDAWREVYDSFAGAQHEGGVTYQQVMRSTSDPSEIVVMHWFETREAAEAFFGRDDLKEAMGRGTVDPASFSVEFLEDLGGGHPGGD
jgi:hypothetical protein